MVGYAVQSQRDRVGMAEGEENSKPRNCCWPLLIVLIIDFSLILTLAILGIILGLALKRPPVTLGFFCNDETIRYPAKEDTFSISGVIVASLLIPLFICVVQEVWNTICIARKRKQLTARTVLLLSLRCFLKIVYLELMVILSLMVTSIITEVGKIFRGRHRPWFLQACNPDFSKINCTDAFGNPLLVDESVCRPNHTTALIEARKSWPSGHSSVIFCGMTISMLLVYYTPLLKASIGFRVSVMMTLFVFAMIVGLSRISDYFHRWHDVLWGAIFGASVSIFVFYSFVYKDKMIERIEHLLRPRDTNQQSTTESSEESQAKVA